jgi:hypothetical protein
MAMSSSSLALSELRDRIARLEGGAARRREVLPFGVPEIDRVLPGGGLALGALHEVAGGANGAVDGEASGTLGIAIRRWRRQTEATDWEERAETRQRRRGYRQALGQPLRRRPHLELAQDQVHEAAGVRRRRLPAQ